MTTTTTTMTATVTSPMTMTTSTAAAAAAAAVAMVVIVIVTVCSQDDPDSRDMTVEAAPPSGLDDGPRWSPESTCRGACALQSLPPHADAAQ